MKTETLKFLREYFRIPKSRKISWGIVEETSATGTEYRLGVVIRGTNLFLDVALRRFYSQVELRSVSRKIYPAERKSNDRFNYVFIAENGLSIKCSKTFIVDIYYPALYSKQLIKEGAL